VVAWGANDYSQTMVPSGLTGVTAIAAGGYHTLALKNDGTVVAWGDNSIGQRTVPTGVTGVTAIAAGYNYSVAVKRDGTVVAWGNYPIFSSPLTIYENAVPGTVSYNQSTRTAIYTPTHLLGDGVYQAQVNTGVETTETLLHPVANTLWKFNVGGKPGDCNSDGTISIAEVQGAINMYLGTKAIGCGVDTNSSSSVSIAEVQKVINGYLGM
jgi:alpha-tubulin suppressor-like RCC1 family protein